MTIFYIYAKILIPYGPASLSGGNPPVETPHGGFPPQKVETPNLMAKNLVSHEGGGFPPSKGGNPPPEIPQWAKVQKKCSINVKSCFLLMILRKKLNI